MHTHIIYYQDYYFCLQVQVNYLYQIKSNCSELLTVCLHQYLSADDLWTLCCHPNIFSAILCGKCVCMELKWGWGDFTGTASWSRSEEEWCCQITPCLLSTPWTPLQLCRRCCLPHLWPSSSVWGAGWHVFDFHLAWPQRCILHCSLSHVYCDFDVKPRFQPKMLVVLLPKFSRWFRYFCLLVHWDCGISV